MRHSSYILLLFVFATNTFAQHPTNLTSSNISSTSAELSWTDNGCGTSIKLRYRELGGTWQPSNSGQSNVISPYSLTGLNPNTNYEWTVKCSGSSGWASNVSFSTTAGCNLLVSNIVTDASCSNTMDGSITVSVSNGTSPYTFLWDNGATTQNLTSITAGTYIVQISDNSGCTTTDTATIGAVGNESINQQISDFNPNPLTAYHQWSYDTLRIVNTGCDVRIRPEFSISCSSGPIQQGDMVIKWQHPLGWNQTINYTIDANGDANGFWSSTANDSTGTDITFGQIQDIVVQVKFVSPALYGDYVSTWETFKVDNLGNKLGSLSNVSNVILSLVDCSLFSISNISTNNVSCNGGTDGSSTITNITGGSGNYSYQWSNGGSGSNISNLSSGTYSVIVTDNNWGCIDSSSITINEPAIMTANASVTNISCNGLNDGVINTSASGGSGQFDVIWTSHPWLPPVPNQSNLSADTYLIDVIDLNCGDIVSLSYTISEPDVLSYSISSSNNTSCDSSICNGNINMSLLGGTIPYSYIWNNGYTDSTRTDLCANTYVINLIDANGCGNFTETIIISDSTSTASATITSTNVSCFGFSDGSAEAIIGGGNSSSSGNISTLNYCASGPGTNTYSTIDLVRLIGDGDSISNNTANIADDYEDYTSQFTNLTPGQSYVLNINLGTENPGQYQIDSGKVFIDWNIDGDFDDIGEEVASFGGVQSPISETINFTVPNIAYGPTRMRIVSQAQANNPSFPNGSVGACDVGDFGALGTYNQPWWGATEDYSVVISGIIPATYLWSNGDTNQTINNLSPGTYSCTVTDTNNCSVTESVTITEPSIISVSENITDVSCNGLNDGTATLNISGGTPSYIEDWGTNNPNLLSAGNYTYVITDNNGCIFTDSIIINEPSLINLTSNITNVLCYSDSSGSIDINITGGSGAYNYLWSNGSTSEDILNIVAGIYIVNITDTNSCVLIDTFIISEPSSPISATKNITNTTCYGYSDGSVILTASGGTGSLQENWFGYNPLALSAGTYTYTITDSNSCSYLDSVTINEPNQISSTPLITNVNCYGLNDGTATINISGGTPSYIEDWGTNNPDSLSAGNYTYVITDNNGCTLTDSVLISQPDSLTVSYTQTNVDCYGNSNGSAIVLIYGGTTNYVLSWDTLTYPLLGGLNTFSTPVGVPAGTYPFGITDANGCFITDTITINQPNQISVIKNISDYNGYNISCNGGSNGAVSILISGGTPSYIEDWGIYNPDSLSAGTYVFQVTDNNGCVYTDSISVTEPNQISSSATILNLTSCVNPDGEIDLSVSGGVYPYNYLWNNNDTTEDISNLQAGNYYVIVTDQNNCTYSDTAIVTQPSNNLALNLTANNYNGFNISCFGYNDGIIYSNASGGSGSLNYLWSDMTSDSILSNQTTGIYSLTVTDTNGCSLTDSITLTEPSLLTSTNSKTDALCHGDSSGSATVIFNGGVTDYLLSWNGYTYPLINGLNIFTTPIGVPAGTYPYSVIDLNGCTNNDTIYILEPDSIVVNHIISDYNGYDISCHAGNDGTVSLTISGGTPSYIEDWGTNNPNLLSAGNYTYVITDNNGCIFTDSISLSEPTEITTYLELTNLSCFNSCDGQIISNTAGGIAPYNYSWDNGQSNDTIINLCANIYSVTISDQNQCILIDSGSLTQPTKINILVDSIINVSTYNGNDGQIYTSSSGGIGVISYSWSGPLAFNSSNNNINNLVSGNYILTASDTTGCSSVDTIFVDQPPSLSVMLDSLANLSCFGHCDGKIHITADGGDSVYTYLWNGPNGFTSTDEDIDSLCAGIYHLTLSDTTSSIQTSFSITEPTQLSIIINADTALCFGGTAQASAYSYGGQYPYQTLWDNGSTSISTHLYSGQHYVTVTDTNGCTASESIDIIENDQININLIGSDATCFGLANGSVQINVLSGGTAPYTYSDNNGQSFQNINIFSNLNPGIHHYIIRDINDCLASDSITINEPNELLSTIIYNDVSCYGYCDGNAISNISGGTPPYVENWGGLDQNNLCAGLVNLIIEDNNGCLTTNSIIITEPNQIIVNLNIIGNTLVADSGFLFYQWIDNNGSYIIGETSYSYTPNQGGMYAVEVTDSNLCTITSEYFNFIIENIDNVNSNIIIYPNPTNGWITIETTKEIPSQIRILNILGETILELNSDEITNNNMINLSYYNKGSYLIELINNDTIITHKITLQ